MSAPHSTLSRREFIRVTTLTGGGFLLSLALPGEAWAQASQALDDTTKAFTPGPFIKITPENIITILAKSPVLVVVFVFCMIRLRCSLTVYSLRVRRLAISLLVKPSIR